MLAEQFVYWLQGYAELNPNRPPDLPQWCMIVGHLKEVFNKRTPDLGHAYGQKGLDKPLGINPLKDNPLKYYPGDPWPPSEKYNLFNKPVC